MEHNDIYQILENLDAAQKSVKQLPALFKPAQTSPQLSGSYPGKNATLGYLVGEADENDPEAKERERLLTAFKKKQLPQQNFNLVQRVTYDQLKSNPMAQAVIRRIANAHPEWLMKYGPEAVMQAVEDVTEGDTEWEEIGSSDVSAYVNYVGDYLRDRGGDRSDMDEQDVSEGQDDTSHQVAQQILKQHRDARTADEDTIITAAGTALQQMGMTPQQIRGIMNNPDFAGDVIDHVRGMSENVSESATTEDVISTVKKKLGDYLQDVATAIKKDPDLMAKLPQTVNDIKATKTITTDDGKEIKIHGNEDDGFRISIRNQDIKTKFPNLDEAVMAVEMYCARRRGVRENADYIEEKRP